MKDSLDSISAAASNCLESGDLRQALQLFGEATALAKAAGKHEELSTLLGELAVTQRRLGDEQSAIDTNRRAIEIARACGHDLNVARWSGNLGGLLYHRNETDAAEACFKEAVVASARTGLPDQMSIAAGHLAGMMSEHGRFSDAVDTMEQARDHAGSNPQLAAIIRDQEVCLLSRWADTLRRERRMRQAREVIARALSIDEASPASKDRVMLLILLADIEEYGGDIVSACDAIERAIEASESMGDLDGADRLRELVERMRG